MRTQFPIVLGSIASLMYLAGCGGGDEAPAPPSGPTFTRVTQEVMTQVKCGGPLCHGTSAGGFHLGSKSDLHSQLVDQPATGAKCRASALEGGAQPYIRVIPKNPDESLLYRKINHDPPCGDAMPVAGTLTEAQITLVHDWIAAGAKDD